jgi:hypothetical protein
MTPHDRERLRQRRAALLQELHGLPNLMRGTVYEPERKCGRASCACATGGPRHRTVRLNVTLGGRTRTRYVRHGERAAIEAMVAAYQRLWALVDELTEVNLQLLHRESAGRRAR